MAKEDISIRVTDMLEPFLKDNGLDIYKVEYKKEGEKNREKFFLGGVVNYYLGEDELNGTYNAFVRMGKKSDWYCYEDENVYSVTFDDIKNNGYPVVLFYHKLTKKSTEIQTTP